MSAEFFYRTYAKFSKRGRRSRLKITPFGMIVIAVCIISGTAGLNIFDYGLYRIFTLTLSLIIAAKFLKTKIGEGLAVTVFFDKQYRAGEISKYKITLINGGSKDLSGLELVPEIENSIPSLHDFLKMKEPGEEKRNIWDRNIFYFRWVWHILRLHKAEFTSLKNISVNKNGFNETEGYFIPLKRGIIYFKSINVISKDIFGIFSEYYFMKAEHEIVILPALINIDDPIKSSIITASGKRNTSRSNYLLKNKSGDFIGMRDYLPGDPQKNIHWKSWAKRDRPVIVEKGYDRIKECSVILLNCGSVKYDDIRFEDCVSYLYSFLKYLDGNGFEVSFYSISDKAVTEHFRAEEEKGNFHKLYNVLAGIRFLDDLAAEQFISGLRKIHDPFCPSYMFCLEPEPAVLRFATERNIKIITASNDYALQDSGFRIPRINSSVMELNQT
jgi:hypothetical protein